MYAFNWKLTTEMILEKVNIIDIINYFRNRIVHIVMRHQPVENAYKNYAFNTYLNIKYL